MHKTNDILSSAFTFLAEYHYKLWEKFKEENPRIKIKIASYAHVGEWKMRASWQPSVIDSLLELYATDLTTVSVIGAAILDRKPEPYTESWRAAIRRYACLMMDNKVPPEKISEYLDFLLERDALKKKAEALGFPL